jgi:hypothetical protein
VKIGIIIASLVIAAALAGINCRAEESEGQGVETAQGSVTAIDWVGSVITVEDTRFQVPSGIKVYKGDDQLGFSDVNKGDQVTVMYKKESPGILKAISITVEYSGDLPT